MPDSELSFAAWDELCGELNARTDTLIVVGVLKSDADEIATYFAGPSAPDMMATALAGLQVLAKRLPEDEGED